mmetsp:Transcript_21366/g.23732  ORF Transcript_21366/g.23732 Transcript_21366/m.23732 type:complete len:90 (-) Transcript_21366:967-1236(-)
MIEMIEMMMMILLFHSFFFDRMNHRIQYITKNLPIRHSKRPQSRIQRTESRQQRGINQTSKGNDAFDNDNTSDDRPSSLVMTIDPPNPP